MARSSAILNLLLLEVEACELSLLLDGLLLLILRAAVDDEEEEEEDEGRGCFTGLGSAETDEGTR